MAAGAEAYRQNDYAEAKRQLSFALGIASLFRPQDPRLALSLDSLALLYKNQGKYAEVEPLYQRALAIAEKALGPEHPDVATISESYATLLHETGRSAEAAELEIHAKAIRLKYFKAIDRGAPCFMPAI